MAAELIPMPASPQDTLRVNAFYPFEEAGKRLLIVVENAAFSELDDAAWTLCNMIAGKPKVRRSELVERLSAQFDPQEAEGTVFAFEQLEVLEPMSRPRGAPDISSVPVPPVSSLVLHVSHDCNMRCAYCYADFGRYGGDFGYMEPELAVEHAARFFDQLGDTNRVHMTFFGGEPLMNMPVVYAAHEYAKARAAREGRRIAFGLTTNGTLLTPELVSWFQKENFSITVSIDGPPDVNNKLRPLNDGGDSYEAILQGVTRSGIRAQARVTLTKKCVDIAKIVRHLIGAGFTEVGVSPVASGMKQFDLDDADLETLLQGNRALADDFVHWAKQGKVFPYSNLRTLLEQIAIGDPRPVPCGAGTKLVAADNKGDLYACHRLVGQDEFKMGNVADGLDREQRFALLKKIHPRTREPCQTCWARYMCGGGCHHIAWLHAEDGAPWEIREGFCDFLRGWYRLGLHTYARLVEEAPDVLARLSGPRSACSQPQGQ